FGKCTLQHLHVGDECLTIDLRCEPVRMKTSCLAKRHGRLREIYSFNSAVEFLTEGKQEFMKSLLHRRIPAPRCPTERRRMFFIVITVLILPVSAAVILRVFHQTLRHRNPALAKRDVLNLKPKPLAVCIE